MGNYVLPTDTDCMLDHATGRALKALILAGSSDCLFPAARETVVLCQVDGCTCLSQESDTHTMNGSPCHTLLHDVFVSHIASVSSTLDIRRTSQRCRSPCNASQMQCRRHGLVGSLGLSPSGLCVCVCCPDLVIALLCSVDSRCWGSSCSARSVCVCSPSA